MAIVLTRDDSSQIYLIRPDGSGLRRITFSGSIDTEPNFSPDGQTLLFTSDHGGSPQIYCMPVAGGPAQRLTFGDGNNFSPHYSPDGKDFVYTNFIMANFISPHRIFRTARCRFLLQADGREIPVLHPMENLSCLPAKLAVVVY